MPPKGLPWPENIRVGALPFSRTARNISIDPHNDDDDEDSKPNPEQLRLETSPAIVGELGADGPDGGVVSWFFGPLRDYDEKRKEVSVSDAEAKLGDETVDVFVRVRQTFRLYKREESSPGPTGGAMPPPPPVATSSEGGIPMLNLGGMSSKDSSPTNKGAPSEMAPPPKEKKEKKDKKDKKDKTPRDKKEKKDKKEKHSKDGSSGSPETSTAPPPPAQQPIPSAPKPAPTRNGGAKPPPFPDTLSIGSSLFNRGPRSVNIDPEAEAEEKNAEQEKLETSPSVCVELDNGTPVKYYVSPLRDFDTKNKVVDAAEAEKAASAGANVFVKLRNTYRIYKGAGAATANAAKDDSDPTKIGVLSTPAPPPKQSNVQAEPSKLQAQASDGRRKAFAAIGNLTFNDLKAYREEQPTPAKEVVSKAINIVLGNPESRQTHAAMCMTLSKFEAEDVEAQKESGDANPTATFPFKLQNRVTDKIVAKIDLEALGGCVRDAAFPTVSGEPPAAGTPDAGLNTLAIICKSMYGFAEAVQKQAAS